MPEARPLGRPLAGRSHRPYRHVLTLSTTDLVSTWIRVTSHSFRAQVAPDRFILNELACLICVVTTSSHLPTGPCRFRIARRASTAMDKCTAPGAVLRLRMECPRVLRTRRVRRVRRTSRNVRTLVSLTHDPDTKHVPCKFFYKGQCAAGDTCPYSHNLEPPEPCKFFLNVSLAFPSLV